MRQRNAMAPVFVASVLVCLQAVALINPNYTPVDLVEGSGRIWLLRVSAPQAGRMIGEVVEALRGAAPAEKQVVFDFRNAAELEEGAIIQALGGASAAMAVMCIQNEEDREQGDALTGALEIGTKWMGLTQDGSSWKLDRDPRDIETVWGGSARQLVRAIRYTLSNPRPDFPVVASLTWMDDLSLGTLDGPARGCRLTSAGVFVLSEAGDRVYRPAKKGGLPEDVTEALNVTTASKALTIADVNDDSRPDLVSWNGKRVRVALGGPDGAFGKPAAGPILTNCCSLAALGGGVVAGQPDGISWLGPGSEGGLQAHRLENGAHNLGPGGVCAVADFTGDGATDILQVFARGLVMRRGTPDAGVFAAPTVTELEVVIHPTALVCGDYDADGLLDLMVGGKGGTVLLCRVADGAWRNVITETGELGEASGLGRNEAIMITDACATDLNGDGRQCAAVIDAGAAPGLFFNRGFACFGIARSLDFSELDLPSAEALGRGQSAGIVTDLNGDLSPDLLAVDREHGVWVMFTEAQTSRRFQAAVTLARPSMGPLTLTIRMGGRRLGMWVIRPGVPTRIALPKAGKVNFQWRQRDGVEKSRDILIVRPTHVEI